MPMDPLQTLEVPQETLSPAAKRLIAVRDEIMARRNVKPPVHVVQPVPAGIAEKTRLEVEEGKKRVAMAKANQANRPVPKPDKSEPTTTPVYRPLDFVPNFNQGKAKSTILGV